MEAKKKPDDNDDVVILQTYTYYICIIYDIIAVNEKPILSGGADGTRGDVAAAVLGGRRILEKYSFPFYESLWDRYFRVYTDGPRRYV